jgi:hypothetical protein
MGVTPNADPVIFLQDCIDESKSGEKFYTSAREIRWKILRAVLLAASFLGITSGLIYCIQVSSLTADMKSWITIAAATFSTLAFSFFNYKHYKLQESLVNAHLLRRHQLENIQFAIIYSRSPAGTSSPTPQSQTTTPNPIDFRQGLNLISNTRNPITEEEITRIGKQSGNS